MVRVKHRWLCIELSCAEEYNLKSDFKPSDALAKSLRARSQCLTKIDEHHIAQAVRDVIQSTFGDLGLGILNQMFSIEYWRPVLGIVVLKVACAHHQMIRAGILFLNEIGSLTLRPNVISDCATLVQTRRFLLTYLHRWMGINAKLLQKSSSLLTGEEDMIRKAFSASQ